MIISGKTKIYGLIGNPVENSYSPYIYNSALEQTGIDGRYLAFYVPKAQLNSAVQGIKGLSIKGVNVTAPFKENVIKYLDTISPIVKYIGAVNTIINNNGKLSGFNTDYLGFLKQLQQLKGELDGKTSLKITIFGAGGAARAIVFSLLLFFNYLESKHIEETKNLLQESYDNQFHQKQIQSIEIINRDEKKASSLKEMIEKLFYKDRITVVTKKYNPTNFSEVTKNCDIFINATSLGFKGCPVLNERIPDDIFTDKQIVVDLAYNLGNRSFFELGRKARAKIYCGLDMLIYQAEASFYLFTGHRKSFESIKRNILETLE